MDSSAVSARLIGMMFVEKGLITEEQLELALEQQRATGDRLGEILVEQFGVERLDLAGALAEQWAEYEHGGTIEERASHAENRDLLAVSDEWRGFDQPDASGAHADVSTGKRPIGEIFVERGLISAKQLEEALDEQKESGRRLGEILVATGRLSRLELASALADQWASFQKLRPPGADTPGETRIMPTPEAAVPSPSAAASAELARRIEELAARMDGLAEGDAPEDKKLEETAEALRARIDQLERSLPTGEPEAVHELRSGLADITARIDAIPAPDVAWRSDLAEVAENLRTRVERLEQGLEGVPRTAEIADLRGSLDELDARIDSLPAPSEEWREPLAELRASVVALTERADLTKAQTEKWRGKLASLREQLEQLASSGDAGIAELRVSLEVLAAHVHALPGPSEEWREPLAELAARLDALPKGEWRPELAEVAENLRTRLERIEQSAVPDAAGIAELHGSLEALSARVESLPAPSEEWREPLAELAARLDALPKGEWRSELGEVAENLRTRVERVEQGLEGASSSAEIAELRSWVEALRDRADSLPAPSEEWREPLASLRAWVEQLASSDGSDMAELRGSFETLAARVESLQMPSEDWREPLADLAAQLDVLSSPSEEWRDAVSTLAARLDALSANDAQSELAEAAESLGKRIERIEEGMVGQARAAAVAEIAEHVAEVARKVEGLPASSDEWREQLASLTARLDSMPAVSAEWRDDLAALAARVDAIRTDEWRSELGQLAENLRARIERVEQESATGQTAELHELRSELGALAARMDAMPAPLDTIRAELVELAHALYSRVDEVEHRLSSEPGSESFDGLRSELGALAARMDAIPAPLDAFRAELADVAQALHNRVEHVELRLPTALGSDTLDGLTTRVNELASRIDESAGAELRLRESLSALADEQAEGTKADIVDVHGRLDDVTSRLDLVTEAAARMSEIERRLDDAASPVAAFGPQLDELKQTADRSAHRAEKLSQRMDELASRRDAAEVEQVLAQRIAAAEQTLAGLHTGLAAVPPLVEERLAVVEERADDAARQAAAGVESLRQELGELRAGVEAARDAATERVDAVASALRDDLEAAAERVAGGAVGELRSVVDAHGGRLESLAGDLVSAEQRGAGRSADLSALRARLETVESAVARAGGWSDAVDGANARIEGLEASLIESFTAEAVERDAQIHSLRAEVSERADALEKGLAKRKDIRELRDAVKRVERRVDDRLTEDQAVVQATEAAVRDGLASLGERLSASGDAYLETSRELSRSIAGLGLALSASDAHGVERPRLTDRPIEISVFLAFAPTAEGYRLVECAGSAPVLGGEVAIEDCEGPLVVTRVGASPLPFDPRPCVYLDRA